jgi:hypothetical protein
MIGGGWWIHQLVESHYRCLFNWPNLYDEAKTAKVPDVCYTDEEYPVDSIPIRDLLQATQLQDAYFANQWSQRVTEYEER